MANYQFSSDLIDDALWRVGEPIDDTSDFQDAAVRYLNRAYQAIQSGGAEFDPDVNEVWWRLKAEASLTLQTKITTGTVSVTKNSTSITFSSAPASSVEGWFFKVEDHADVFKIASHTGGLAAATLDTVYTDGTAATAAYKLFDLEYDLASDLQYLISPIRAYQNSRQKIDVISMTDMEDQYTLNNTQERVPTRAAMVDEDTIRFNSFPTQLTRLDYDYIKFDSTALTDSGTQEVLIPRQYRRILALFVAFWLAIDKNDDRATEYGAEGKSLLQAMAKENRRRWSRMGRLGQIFPRMNPARHVVGPLRTESGLILGW